MTAPKPEKAQQIDCTYLGTPENHTDLLAPGWRWSPEASGPVLICDKHGIEAQGVVYESSDTGPFVGPCHWYSEVPTGGDGRG